jgi:hypothetical protein
MNSELEGKGRHFHLHLHGRTVETHENYRIVGISAEIETGHHPDTSLKCCQVS